MNTKVLTILLFATSMVATCMHARVSMVQNKKATLGDIFEITLEATPGTGYTWYYLMPGSGAPVEFVSMSSDSTAKRMGAPAKQTWKFMPRQEGTWLITFANKGPGVKESVEKLMYFEVEVAAKTEKTESAAKK